MSQSMQKPLLPDGESEWGPTDKGTSIADDPLHVHLAHSYSWCCTHEG